MDVVLKYLNMDARPVCIEALKDMDCHPIYKASNACRADPSSLDTLLGGLCGQGDSWGHQQDSPCLESCGCGECA